jgi:hypothetical protein
MEIMDLPAGDGVTLPADNNGHVSKYSKIERSPHSMAPLRCC